MAQGFMTREFPYLLATPSANLDYEPIIITGDRVPLTSGFGYRVSYAVVTLLLSIVSAFLGILSNLKLDEANPSRKSIVQLAVSLHFPIAGLFMADPLIEINSLQLNVRQTLPRPAPEPRSSTTDSASNRNSNLKFRISNFQSTPGINT